MEGEIKPEPPPIVPPPRARLARMEAPEKPGCLILLGYVLGVFVCLGTLLTSVNRYQPAPERVMWFSVYGVAAAAAVICLWIAHRKAPRSLLAYVIELGTCGVFSFVVLAVTFPVLVSSNAARSISGCLSSAKRLAMGVGMYMSDNDDGIPTASSWRTAIDPYLGDKSTTCVDAKSKWHYGLNQALSGKSGHDLTDATETVLIFEMDSDVPNAAGGPANAADRHEDWYTLAYVDGHVIRRGRQEMSNLRWQP
jgi:hypothetical protein